MTMTDPLGDMLTRIRNGLTAKKSLVECPMSSLKESVLIVLKKEGFTNVNLVKNDDEYDLNSFKLKIYKAGKPYNTTTFAYSINDSRSKVFHEPHMFNQQLEISNVDACIITVDMVKVFGLVQVSMGLNQAKLAMSKLNAKYFIATGIAPKRTSGLISYLLSIKEYYQGINLMPASCQQVGDSLSL